MKIGIAITTYNRNAVCEKTLQQVARLSPSDAKIVVVDDCSRIPFKKATYRFNRNVGAPTAKNKCLELLDDCDHIFLFDDDCSPVVADWWKPYVESPEPHLNYTFKYPHEVINRHKVHTNPNGCMMYFDRKVLDVVGGFDTEFRIYGYWHGNMSMRIHNAGITTHPFMDVLDSDKLFASLDKMKRIRTSRPDQGRYLPANKQRYQDLIESKAYIEYRTKERPRIFYSNPYSTDKNIGRALNEFCALVPDDAWICLQDGDMMYLTPDWGKQIEDVIAKHGTTYSLIGCVTNRLGRDIQRLGGVLSEDHDMRNHYRVAEQAKNDHWAEVTDITSRGFVAGMFMLFPKSVWLKHKFVEGSPTFDDEFSRAIVRGGGKLGLMTGLYVYHLYRIWSDSPAGDKKHLIG